MEKVFIQIESNIDGETVTSTADGEYRFKDGKHWIVYTEYTGNVVTKNGIIADDNSLLLHRTGGISGDMVFEPGMDTFTHYEALSLGSTLVIHTREYRLEEDESQVVIQLKYSMSCRAAVNDAAVRIQVRKK